eukprot:TRINITY_DN42851_c0_g1_i1.p1 TRINITY_DN42851_c0_g1~~TRINITY_DN42851_c0_g1_i1.p1  ORF type:complete len:188 (-),score=45.41 TRINITY_DN42851_c0_g1_i1:75-638(-)
MANGAEHVDSGASPDVAPERPHTAPKDERIHQLASEGDSLREENEKLKQAILKAKQSMKFKVVRKDIENLTLKNDNQELATMLAQVKAIASRREEIKKLEATEGKEAVQAKLRGLREERRQIRATMMSMQPKPVRAAPGSSMDSPSESANPSPAVTPRFEQLSKLRESRSAGGSPKKFPGSPKSANS